MLFALIFLAAAARFLPHPPNVACIGALGLFAGYTISGWKSWVVPMSAMIISDVIGHVFSVPGMGFYSPMMMLTVYVGLAAAVPLGRIAARINQRRSKTAHQSGDLASRETQDASAWGRFAELLRRGSVIAGGSVAASTVFFVVSNLGVWAGGAYPASAGGLLACFAAAIPFYGLTLAGDLGFSSILFGVTALQWHLSASRQAIDRATPALAA